MNKPGGNGSSRFNVHQDDMGGWVRVFTDHRGPLPEDFPVFLSQALSEWFRLRPNLRMRCVVPVVRDGDTVELHAWYEAHLFPAFQGPAPISEGPR